MYLKYKIQKYIYVFCILKILYKIQNGTMANNFFKHHVHVLKLSQLMLHKFKQDCSADTFLLL